MAHIQSIYLQCGVTAEDQQSLKFLWFQDGDTKQEIVDLSMMSQALGITLSGGSVGYLLQHMALDNRTHASKATTDTVCHNVYVDDILKYHGLVSESIASPA